MKELLPRPVQHKDAPKTVPFEDAVTFRYDSRLKDRIKPENPLSTMVRGIISSFRQ